MKRGTDLLGQKSSRALHGASTRSRSPVNSSGAVFSKRSLALGSEGGAEELETSDPFQGVTDWEESAAEYHGTRVRSSSPVPLPQHPGSAGEPAPPSHSHAAAP